jgi:hypothetical protein
VTKTICAECRKEILDGEDVLALTFPDPHLVHEACNREAIKKSVVRDRLHSVPLLAGRTYQEWINDITKRWRLK